MAVEIEGLTIKQKSVRKGETSMNQNQINNICVRACKIAQYYYSNSETISYKHLIDYNAIVYGYGNGNRRAYVLKSYDSIVALISTSGRCYDFLRYDYGYTVKSAHHISKFFKDYAQENAERMTYRNII